MAITATLSRRILPALLLASLVLASCGRKDCDPRPRKQCDKGDNTTTSTTKPGGAS